MSACYVLDGCHKYMSVDQSTAEPGEKDNLEEWAASRVEELRKVVASGQAAGVFTAAEVLPALDVDRAVRELERVHARTLRLEQAKHAVRAQRESLALLKAEFALEDIRRTVENLHGKSERLQRCYHFIEQGWHN